MKYFGLENLPRTGATVLIWHQVPVTDHQPCSELGGRTLHWTEATGLKDLERGEIIVLRASQMPLGSSCLGRLPLAQLAAIQAIRPDCPIIPVVEDAEAQTISLGASIRADQATGSALRRALNDLGVEAFRSRSELGQSLGMACVQGLKRKWFQPVYIDGFGGGRVLRGGMVLAASWRLADWMRGHVRSRRLGIVLPPGGGAVVANLACLLAGIVPVNLNFTSGRQAIQAALQKGEIETVLTAEAVKNKLKDFPWPEATIDLREIMAGFPKISILGRWLVGALLPARALGHCLKIDPVGGDREATLLFTSGSDGDPKGVVLTHRNILSNVQQIAAVLSRGPIESMLACLPIFHSFGCTVTLWWPLLGGPRGITYVSPTETTKLVELIEKYQVNLLINTPTFLRNFLRKAQPEQLRSLKVVVTGAEKLPLELRRDFEQRFAVPVCEGYGMTEASPVVAVNLVEFDQAPGSAAYEIPRRMGSVGRLVPGLSAKICDPESGVELPLESTGMIWLRGANLFPGYLTDTARTAKVLVDGWYCSGDCGRVDVDGFLWIDGRLSRFSKIAGEMVPHGVVETQIMTAFRAELGEDFQAIIVGVPDEKKGEALILLSTCPLDLAEVRRRLAAAGLPNLWAPREVRHLPEIPLMATGKLDFKQCQRLALESAITSNNA